MNICIKLVLSRVRSVNTLWFHCESVPLSNWATAGAPLNMDVKNTRVWASYSIRISLILSSLCVVCAYCLNGKKSLKCSTFVIPACLGWGVIYYSHHGVVRPSVRTLVNLHTATWNWITKPHSRAGIQVSQWATSAVEKKNNTWSGQLWEAVTGLWFEQLVIWTIRIKKILILMNNVMHFWWLVY